MPKPDLTELLELRTVTRDQAEELDALIERAGSNGPAGLDYNMEVARRAGVSIHDARNYCGAAALHYNEAIRDMRHAADRIAVAVRQIDRLYGIAAGEPR